MVLINKKNTKIIVLTLITLLPIFIGTINYQKDGKNGNQQAIMNDSIDYPSASLPLPNYDWWNSTWTMRIPVEIRAVGNQLNAPVELEVNFTNFFNDLGVQNPDLNVSTIRVVEYTSSNSYYEIECQFDPYPYAYDSNSNAIGDVVWILNGTTLHNEIRDFFIYFINGSDYNIPDPNYAPIRIWHEGFEDFNPSDLLRPTDGQDNYHPTFWEVSNTTSARGQSSLLIWGNCWKASDTGTININSNTRVTAKMRFDDPTVAREISGIGFRVGESAIPSPSDSYIIRGNQNWGNTKFRNLYYTVNTFFWYTFILDTEISLNSFNRVFYVADDDSYTNLNLYWDDISIWSKPVQTTPNNTLSTTLGEIQPISYSLKVICKDEQGQVVPNAYIYISNNLNPLLNQNGLTDESGQHTFLDIAHNGVYNVTINYTQQGLSNPSTATVYSYENYAISMLNSVLTTYLTLTKLDFNITDKDGEPVDYGFVLLKEGVQVVGKAVLDASGQGSLRWLNNTAYDYEVYYDYASLPATSRYKDSNLLIYQDTTGFNHNFDISTEITKIILNVTDNSPERVPFTNAKLRFYNQSDYDDQNQILANITVDINGLARFVSFSDSYGTWGDYTVDIYFGGQEVDFYADLAPLEHELNFTLTLNTEVSIRIPTNKDLYNSTINVISLTTTVNWGENVNVVLNFTKQDESEPLATKVSPDELTVQILDEELTVYSAEVSILPFETSVGVFNYSFNTLDFGLLGGNVYFLKFNGNYKSYFFNAKLPSQIFVQERQSGIRYYDYSLNELTNKQISSIFLESVNITVEYYELDSGLSLENADVRYSWDYGSGILADDPQHTGYYYFEFDTSLAPSDAQYIIDIYANLQNYSIITDTILIDILARPTSINGTTTLLQSSPKIYVLESQIFNFEYLDVLTSAVIIDLDVTSYNWYRLDENGNPLSGPGNEGTGYLTLGAGNRYSLDFDTELKEVGEYTIFVTLQKNNYEVKNAFLALSIVNRPISTNIAANGLDGQQIRVVQGSNINFEINLYDLTNLSQPLSGASVSLTIGNLQHNFTETQLGIYTYSLSTSDVQAFFIPNTINGELKIEKDNFETQSIQFTIIVGMVEIFPGFPLFYFLIIVIGIVAIAGSLVAYRQIQRARIPTFVKKVREMSKNIKSRKSISDSLLYPSKEEYIVKNFGDKWEMLGLALDDILGIDSKGKKELSDTKELKGGM